MTTSSKVRFPSQSQRQERGKFPIRGQSTRCPFPGEKPPASLGNVPFCPGLFPLVCSRPWFCSATKQFALSKSRTWFLFGGRRGAQSRSGGCESLDKGHRAAATRARPKRARPVVCGSGGSGLRLGIRLQQFEDQRQQRRAPPVGEESEVPDAHEAPGQDVQKGETGDNNQLPTFHGSPEWRLQMGNCHRRQSQLAFRSTSSTASGCFAITANSTRVGASGRDLLCSQFLSVAGGKPNFVANCAWLSPILVRTARTSTSGTCTRVTRTLALSPRVHAIACSNPSAMRAPTLGGFLDRFPILLEASLVAIFAFNHYTQSAYPSQQS